MSDAAEILPPERPKSWVGTGIPGPGRPKGSLGGRALALRTLDDVIRKDRNQENLAHAFQAEFDRDPIKFFKQIIMPLLPQDVKIKLGEEGAIQWVSLSTMFPMKGSAPSTEPGIGVSESSVAVEDGARPCPLPPSFSTGEPERPLETMPG